MPCTILTNTVQRPQHIYIQSAGRPIALSVWHRHPQAVTALFYPGTMASPLLYPVLLNALWRKGCNVVGVHPLSHGLSPRIKKDFVFNDILQNGADAAQWIKDNYHGPLVVTGHSQGGILSLAHAVRIGNIDACFPICTLLPQHPRAGLVTRFHKHLKHRAFLISFLKTLASWTPRLPLPFFTYLELWRITAGARCIVAPRTGSRMSYPASFIHSLFAGDLSDACMAGRIKVPVTLFTAKDDALFPLELMRDMLDQVVAPRKELIILNGGGHMSAMSALYAPEIAARIAAQCAALGLALHASSSVQSEFNDGI